MTKRILIAPLDWGLGHATRCIPVIRALMRRGHEVHVASAGPALALLRAEFPGMKSLGLPGYDPVYPTERAMAWHMAQQLPRFISVIRREHRITAEYAGRNQIDLIISDNRYGCWSRTIPSVFITHQSNILMPKRFGWLAPGVRFFNGWLMRRFDICWVPDFPGQHSLAGELISFGHVRYQGRIDYVGRLSRFSPMPGIAAVRKILAICSGPEPQRTIFETILRKQLTDAGIPYLLVRGVISDGGPTEPNVVNYLTSEAMAEAIASSELVIARSGYSTIMDLSVLEKKAIFIPTPGQTEQEYLAHRLKEKGIAFSMEQGSFDLKRAVNESRRFTGFRKVDPEDRLTAAIDFALAFKKQTRP